MSKNNTNNNDPTLYTSLKGHKDTVTGLSFHPALYIYSYLFIFILIGNR